MMRRRHDAEMPSCHQDFEQFWPERQGYAWPTQNCSVNNHIGPFICLLILSNVKTNQKSHLRSLRISCSEGMPVFWKRCICRVHCITPFSPVFCKNVLYQLFIFISSVPYISLDTYLDSFPETLFNGIGLLESFVAIYFHDCIKWQIR